MHRMSKTIAMVFFDTHDHDAVWIFCVGAFRYYITWLRLVKNLTPRRKRVQAERHYLENYKGEDVAAYLVFEDLPGEARKS
jgi:hypothetical protein